MSIFPEMRRPLPNFEQWLDKQGHAGRADGFAALLDLTERALVSGELDLTAAEASFMRMWRGLLVATVELCNLEVGKGREAIDIIHMLPRVLATVGMYASASVLSAETPYRTLASVLIQEFRAAAKASADTLEKQAG